MTRDDLLAGQAYVKLNWDAFTAIQKLHYLAEYSPDAELRVLLTDVNTRSELLVKIQSIAPWFIEGDKRSEARLAAMLGRKYGLPWWRDIAVADDVDAMLGVMDDVWRSEFFGPLLAKINAPEVTEAETPLTESDRMILVTMLKNGIDHLNPKSKSEIVTINSGGLDTKGLFDNLKKADLVASKRNVGTWLTAKGIETAKYISGI